MQNVVLLNVVAQKNKLHRPLNAVFQSALAYFAMAVSYTCKILMTLPPGLHLAIHRVVCKALQAGKPPKILNKHFKYNKYTLNFHF